MKFTSPLSLQFLFGFDKGLESTIAKGTWTEVPGRHVKARRLKVHFGSATMDWV